MKHVDLHILVLAVIGFSIAALLRQPPVFAAWLVVLQFPIFTRHPIRRAGEGKRIACQEAVVAIVAAAAWWSMGGPGER
ncbi:hypothetical protein [Luteolibacter sp. LG18]|uniref:hypothetical protein n=1 Tax=Luteolibacter sp. LG18 TaxID=2819286 RepID=UPI002B30539B|nr:hypothetical protein llg_27250 [Luteolibacter sp. LG18]